MLHHFYIIHSSKNFEKDSAKEFVKKSLPELGEFEFVFADLGKLDAKKARDIQNHFLTKKLKPTVFFINASSISETATDALLKSFEEPVRNLVFFLRLPDFLNVKPTLYSRAQIIHDTQRSVPTEIEEFYLKPTKQRLESSYFKALISSKDTQKAKAFLVNSLELYSLQSNDWKIKHAKTMHELLELARYALEFASFPKAALESFALLFPKIDAKL